MFKKSCPYCNQLIRLSKLHHIPHTEKLRWYQITPAPSTACPKCGGLVTTTTNNSKLAALLLILPVIIILSSFYILEVREFFKGIPGGPAFLVILFIPFVIWVSRRAKLVKVKS